jgi:hypothetical protein
MAVDAGLPTSAPPSSSSSRLWIYGNGSSNGRRAAPPSTLLSTLMVGVLLLVATLTTLAWFTFRSDYDGDVYHSQNARHEGGGVEDWERTSRMTKGQCRACEAALGSVEWRKPWWDVHSSKTKARWDWARANFSAVEVGLHSLPGVTRLVIHGPYSLSSTGPPWLSSTGYIKMT